MEANVLSPTELHRLLPPKLGFSTAKSFNTPKFASLRPRLARLRLRSHANSPASGSEIAPAGETSAPTTSPVYTPTPANRDLRTPHSGYHFDGSTRKFFEGWYFKVSIPERKQSFCFMYSVENPAFRRKLTPVEVAQYGPRFTGAGAQILGAYDKYICQYTEESQNFWGSEKFSCFYKLLFDSYEFSPNNNISSPSS